MLRNMPFLLIVGMFLVIGLDPFIPMAIKSWVYGLSVCLKSLIIAILPIIIFGLLFKAMVQLSDQATKMIGFILVAVCCSNFISTLISHYVGSWIYQFDFSLIHPQADTVFMPSWTFEFPKIIANDKAMLAGLILGISTAYFKPILANTIANQLDNMVITLLKGVTLIVPVFVIGFVIKLNAEGSVLIILQDYASIFVMIGAALLIYISLIYLATSVYSKRFFAHVKNMLPAAIAGFSTMSSAAAMPLTLLGTEKNSQDPVLARSVIPVTVNIHLIGDCFAIPILAYAILKSFHLPEPSLVTYLIFAGYFVLAKFSVAGVPGGGIIVMLPILETYLGFNAAMLSLITALYILFDPVITCANVLGNGGFALVIDKLRFLFFRGTICVCNPTK